MRTLLAVASLTMLVGAGFGCGDDTTATTMDMTMAAKDMSAAIVDMQKLTCAQILSCVMACSGSQSCELACVGDGSTQAQGLIETFEGCLFGVCGPGDGGNASCSGPTDTSSGCSTCLNNTAGAAALGNGPCAASYSACSSN